MGKIRKTADCASWPWIAAITVTASIGLGLGYLGVSNARAVAPDSAIDENRQYQQWLETLPAEKRLAVLGAKPVPGIDLSGAAPALQKQRPDSGEPAEVALVRGETVRVLESLGQLGVMPAPSKNRRATVMATAARAERHAAATTIWAPRMLSEYSDATERGLDSAVDDPNYAGYDAVQFVVDEWQGVRADPDSEQVSVALLGHFRYREHGIGWTDGVQKQHQLFMEWADTGRRQLRVVGWTSLPSELGASS